MILSRPAGARHPGSGLPEARPTEAAFYYARELRGARPSSRLEGAPTQMK
ncbi:MAG: hypothetical protein LJF30_12850 [Acidobacteria bacterium]|nr:hypothetical protein [Acidobacteriota bacterium]